MADFELAIDLNLRSVLVTTEAAIPEMRARGGGALLYTASTSGLVGSAFSPVYSMAKFGVVGFVRSLAKRLAPDKIRVNAVCPGPIDTPMLRVFVARPDQQQPPGERIDKEQLVVAAQPADADAPHRHAPRRSPTPRCFCCRTRPRSSPGRRCRSMAARPRERVQKGGSDRAASRRRTSRAASVALALAVLLTRRRRWRRRIGSTRRRCSPPRPPRRHRGCRGRPRPTPPLTKAA